MGEAVSRPNESAAVMDDLRPLAAHVVRRLADGRVTPFLGAGASMAGRPPGLEWSPGCDFLPSGLELAWHLAERMRFPAEQPRDLMEVASFTEAELGRGFLYEELHRVFHSFTRPSSLHNFLARFLAAARAKGYAPNPLFVTTNYDDALERALSDAGEEFDVVAYVAEGDQRGLFFHRPPNGEAIVIDRADEYVEIPLDQRPAILKIHGAIDRSNPHWDSFVIAEEQYVEYLTTDVWERIPITILERLGKSHFLFLGYAMRDWNLLVVLHRLGVLPSQYRSWAVQLNPSRVDERRWQRRDIDMFNVRIEHFIEALEAQLMELPDAAN
jgi:hypothetical protein